MSIDVSAISLVLRQPSTLRDFQRAGITTDYFVGEYQKTWNWIKRNQKEHGAVPSPDVALIRFPDLEIQNTRKRDLPVLVSELQKRKKYMNFLESLDEAIQDAGGPDDVDATLAVLQRRLNSLSTMNGNSSVVDLFTKEVRKRVLEDIKKRRSGTTVGIPTGLKKFDFVTGGLHPGRMITVIGRSGVGKSWIDLLLVASAVVNGYKVILYPLEMTLEETAFRLYTIFSQKIYGPNKVVKNLDLTLGRITPQKVARLLEALEDRYKGQLFVADLGSISDSYTVEKIGAEVQTYQPDIFWVDYLTLMRRASRSSDSKDYLVVGELAEGVKRIAQINKCVGGCSVQANRESLKVRSFLPRLEHISFGDAIGHPADQAIAVNTKDQHVYYGCVKNRHGPECGPIKLKWEVNQGIVEDDVNQPFEKDAEDYV